MTDGTERTIDHVVHAVTDLEVAAGAYADLGFTVTPRADHPFGTSNRLVVLDGSYIELVAVTNADRLPESGFAARVAGRLRDSGEGITHLVLSSDDPPSDLAALGRSATGEIFAFSRPAPQPDGSQIKASFECTLMHGTDDLGMFLCKHVAPEAVWNEATMTHPNLARALVSVTLPVGDQTIDEIARAARAARQDGRLALGTTFIRCGPHARIAFDVRIPRTEICGVTVGGRAEASHTHRQL